MALSWEKEYSVNVKVIDEQHKQIIFLLDKLYQDVLFGKDKKIIHKEFDNLLEAAAEHFSTEEKYFDKFKFKGTKIHKKEHKNLVDNLLDFKKRFDAEKIELSKELLDFLEDWLVNHLINIDQKYVKCFNDNGLF